MIKVGVYGASGYMGGEALRILREHPEVDIVWATSRGDQPLKKMHRNLIGSGIEFVKPEGLAPVDAVFFAVPSGVVMEKAPEFVDQGARIIDLGSDFRLLDQQVWERVYGKKHTNWDLAEQAVYGLCEIHRPRLKETRVVANPGCFSSSAIFGLAPLLKENLVDSDKIVIDGVSGTAGAGAEMDPALHHPELGNNVLPYNVVDHRHTYEMEQELGLLAGEQVSVHFTPMYAPITRGILTVSHCFPKKTTNLKEIKELYRDFYKDDFFIQVMDIPADASPSWQYSPYPWVNAVSGTNFCHIGLDVDEKRGRIVVFSVLDSVGKGGSHAGVQNLNLMFGLPEATGLVRFGLHPY